MANIANSGARADLLDTAPHGFPGHFSEPLGQYRCLADGEHPAGVSVETIFNNGDVDIDRVAVFQSLIARNTVANHMVYRGADGFGKPAVVQRGRDGLELINDEPVADLVQFIGADPRFDVFADHIQD